MNDDNYIPETTGPSAREAARVRWFEQKREAQWELQRAMPEVERLYQLSRLAKRQFEAA